MAVSFPDAPRGWTAALLLCCTLAGPATAPGATPRVPQGPINLEAASSDFDYRNNTLLFRRVRITQGGLEVEAQEASATGLNFENSEWSLKGQVQITVPDGKLASSDARVTFRDNQIVSALIRGAPASFEQRLKDSQQLAEGEAGTIDYNVQEGTVRLTGDAWLTDGQNVIRGQTLVYDIGRQRVVANPGGSDPGGVRITINPRQQENSPAPPQGQAP
jgi:lipopolysaccharide export system protein LptA